MAAPFRRGKRRRNEPKGTGELFPTETAQPVRYSASDAALGGFDEMDELGDLGDGCFVHRFEGAERICEIAVFFEEELFISGLQRADVFFGEKTALEADEIDPASRSRISIDDHERRHILDDFRATADDRVFPDPAKLVHGADSGNDRVVIDRDVAGDPDAVGKDDVIPELAIVGDVRVAEEKIVRADRRRDFAVRAAMDGSVFAEDIVIADDEKGRLTDVFEVLGFSADRCEGEELVVLADFRRAIDHDMRVEHAFITKLDIRADDAKRADADVVADFSERRNDSGRMDHGAIRQN